MNQLLSMIKWEFTLQSRYRIIHLSLASVVIYYLSLQVIPLIDTASMRTIFLSFDPLLIGIVFVGALVLFEKTENTLPALTVTPLKRRNYFLAKIISLTILSFITAFLFLLLTNGIEFNVLFMTIGVVLSSVFLILVGFLLVSRCHSINEYLVMMMLAFLILFIPPLLSVSGIYDNILFYLWPTQAIFLLMKGVFYTITTTEMIYGILYLSGWIILCWFWSQKAFYKHLILGG
jgi:fluoroquinolone transport system permease protein